jgi:hypothetical protein
MREILALVLEAALLQHLGLGAIEIRRLPAALGHARCRAL